MIESLKSPTSANPVARLGSVPAEDIVYESDGDYFARRSEEEVRYSADLQDSIARDLHLELADRYATLAAAIRQAERND